MSRDSKLLITQSTNNDGEVVATSQLTVTVGNSITLTCKHESNNRSKVFWTKTGKQTTNVSPSTSTEQNVSRLTFGNFTKFNEGAYVCSDGKHKANVSLVAAVNVTVDTLHGLTTESAINFDGNSQKQYQEDPFRKNPQNNCHLYPNSSECQNQDRKNYYSNIDNGKQYTYTTLAAGGPQDLESTPSSSNQFFSLLLVAVIVGVIMYLKKKCCKADDNLETNGNPDAEWLQDAAATTSGVLTNPIRTAHSQMCEHYLCEERRLINPVAGCQFAASSLLAVPENDDLPPSYAASTANSSVNSVASTRHNSIASTRHSSEQNLNEIDLTAACTQLPTYEEALLNIVISEPNTYEHTGTIEEIRHNSNNDDGYDNSQTYIERQEGCNGRDGGRGSGEIEGENVNAMTKL